MRKILYDAVVAGYLCIDMVLQFQTGDQETNLSCLFIPGKLIEIDGIEFSIGGLVANTGFIMKKFEKRIFLNGLIGSDMIGNIARELLDKNGLSEEGIKTTEKEGTAFGIVIAPPGVDRIFLESTGCSRVFDIGHIDFEAISKSQLFHFGYPPLLRQFYIRDGEQLVKLFSKVKGMGVVTSLDFSLPDSQSESGKQDWLKIVKRVLPHTDIFAPSVEEVLQIMRPGEYNKILASSGDSQMINLIPISMIRDIGKQIIELGVKILLIKAGHRGIYLLTGNISSLNKETGLELSDDEWANREFWCNSYPVEPDKTVNAIGAGDAAVAAFLTAILDRKDAESALKYAALAGRNSLYCNNLYEDLKDWDSMEKELEAEPIELIQFQLLSNEKVQTT